MKMHIALVIPLLGLAFVCGVLFGHHQYARLLGDHFDTWNHLQAQTIDILGDIRKHQVENRRRGRPPAIQGGSIIGLVDGAETTEAANHSAPPSIDSQHFP